MFHVVARKMTVINHNIIDVDTLDAPCRSGHVKLKSHAKKT